MFNRLTYNFRHVLRRATIIALMLHAKELAIEHVIFALLVHPQGLASQIFKKMNLSMSQVQEIEPLKSIWSSRSWEQTEIQVEATLDLGLNPEVIKVIEKASLVAYEHRHIYIGTEHLLAGLYYAQSPLFMHILKITHSSTNELEHHLSVVLKSTSKFSELTSTFHPAPATDSGTATPAQTANKTPALDYFTRNLMSEETQKKLDPVIGREKETERVMSILLRRTKNNPLLIGDPGVGKTAIVEGLAQRIKQGQVPEPLLDKKIHIVDMGLLVAGTMYRGEFENRLKQLIEETQTNPNTILFIDEIHTIIGAGSASGSLDAANLLKPTLSRGEIACIGATTLEEYKRFFEGDAALERRFQPILISEPSPEETIQVLRGIKDRYEKFHRLVITDEALKAAVHGAERYLTDRYFPDKAIDLIDEAAGRVKLTAAPSGMRLEMQTVENQLRTAREHKQQAVEHEDFTTAHAYKIKEDELLLRLQNLTKTTAAQKETSLGIITPQEVSQVVALMAGVPTHDVLKQPDERVALIEEELSQAIIGQKMAIKEISDVIKRNHAGMADEHRPRASLLFLGPSGVGKTLTAKTVAEKIYGSKNALIRLDMSEFSESFTMSKLIGSPAGYVGYKEGNKFTDLVRRRPYSVVLFDEIEKAHPDIIFLLLQILDEGLVTDATGRRINFKHTFIILTSNVGLEAFNRTAAMGFAADDKADQESTRNKFDQTKHEVMKQIQEIFAAEFLNRLDKIVVFEPLSKDSLRAIVEQEINRLKTKLTSRHIKLTVTANAVTRLAEIGFTPRGGARAIHRMVQDHIGSPIADYLIKHPNYSRLAVKIGIKESEISIEYR